MRHFFTLILSLTVVLMAAAQTPQVIEIAQQEDDDGNVVCGVYDVPVGGRHCYWLCVGPLGIGDDTVQVFADPLFKLFVPLGMSLREALVTMDDIQSLLRAAVGSTLETDGCLSPALPTGRLEPVRIMHRKPLLSHVLEFRVEREGYVRATHIQKSDFAPLVSGMKLYRRMHRDLQ